MPLPELTIGLVVRYQYLWHRRSATADTADKDHPACVVATFRRQGRPEDFVIYLPISHTAPSGDEEGIGLPERVKATAGLDSAPQWVLISECNIDTWPSDLRPLPWQPERFHYGRLPPSMFKTIRDRFVERYNDKRAKLVNREPELAPRQAGRDASQPDRDDRTRLMSGGSAPAVANLSGRRTGPDQAP